MRIVLLGGNGLLGSSMVPMLEDHDLVIASRSGQMPVDLATGTGLGELTRDAEVVVHLASDVRRPQETDVGGTRKLLEALDDQHLVYISIVGVDRHPFPYYRAKYEAEQLIEGSGVPHTILRATQFHDFLAFLLSKMCRRWAAFVPSGFVFQPVSTNEVARRLATIVGGPPLGRVDDLAGPEVLSVSHLARSYMTARAREAPVVPFPVPGKSGRAFRAGVHTNSERADGVETWDEYLEQLFDR